MSFDSRKTFKYAQIFVRDAIVADMIMLSERAVFQPATLEVGSDYRIYDVEYAIVDGVTYFKSSEQYTNDEFSAQLFDFKECGNFVKGKVIRVNPKSTIKK